MPERLHGRRDHHKPGSCTRARFDDHPLEASLEQRCAACGCDCNPLFMFESLSWDPCRELAFSLFSGVMECKYTLNGRYISHFVSDTQDHLLEARHMALALGWKRFASWSKSTGCSVSVLMQVCAADLPFQLSASYCAKLQRQNTDVCGKD